MAGSTFKAAKHLGGKSTQRPPFSVLVRADAERQVRNGLARRTDRALLVPRIACKGAIRGVLRKAVEKEGKGLGSGRDRELS
jgi:hypothetical protein